MKTAETTSEGRRVLRTIRLALSLVWGSGRLQFLCILAATVVTSLCVAGQLLLGRQILDLLAGGSKVDAGELAPYLVALGVLLMASALSQAVISELRIPLGEKVTRRTMDEILDVATEVELEEYEGSDFHDRLERARFAAAGQSTAVVFGLVTVMSTIIVAVGVVAVLLAVVPVLVPIAVIGYLPIAYVNMRNNRATHELEWELTELQRERSYLEYVMTERIEAKEIRAYGIAPGRSARGRVCAGRWSQGTCSGVSIPHCASGSPVRAKRCTRTPGSRSTTGRWRTLLPSVFSTRSRSTRPYD